MPEFSVRISGDEFGFSAAHFITFGGTCEQLHGHNYRAAAEVFGPIDENHYVVDFVMLGDLFKSILRELDHSVLLPTEHATIRVTSVGDEVETHFGQRRWVFPRSDCRLLPLANTTAEMLAEYIGQQLRDAIRLRTGQPPRRVRIEIEESPGRLAVCEL